MTLENREDILDKLIDFQSIVRGHIIESRNRTGLAEVSHSTPADTIYQIDTEVDALVEEFCREWAHEMPLVLIAEGIEGGIRDGVKVFPEGSREEDAKIRLLVDPIDGTRGIMYDKRAAWALAGVAPNKGLNTRLRDIEVAVMTELPTSKMGHADVLCAIKGEGAEGFRIDLVNGDNHPLPLQPSTVPKIDHGFATVSNFFPGTKVLASQLMERIVERLIGAADVTKATVFDDQYITTGGQFYELIVGHDRFNADLRPLFYEAQKQPAGLCVHPYDCASLLVAEEAGVIITDARGNPLDGPMDVTSGLAWAGFANRELQKSIEPIIIEFLRENGIR